MSVVASVGSIVIFLSILFRTSTTRGMKSIFWGAAGILALGALGFALPKLPWDIFSLLLGISVMNAAMIQTKGADYLAYIVLHSLYHVPQSVIFIAPLLCYSLAFVFGSGSVALLLIPAVVELSKHQRRPPVCVVPLCIVAAQQAVIVSPTSAMNVYVFSEFGKWVGFSYWNFALLFPAGLCAVLVSSLLMHYLNESRSGYNTSFLLKDDAPVPTVLPVRKDFFKSESEKKAGQRALLIFLSTIVCALFLLQAGHIFSAFVLDMPFIFSGSSIDRLFFLFFTSAATMVYCCGGDCDRLAQHSAFQAGFLGNLQVLVLGTFGTMFIQKWWPLCCHHLEWLIEHIPMALLLLFVMVSATLYSQSISARLIFPFISSLGLSWKSILSAFPGLSALYIFPNHATVNAAIALDDTQSCDLSHFGLNHPFLIPNILVMITHYFWYQLFLAFCGA